MTLEVIRRPEACVVRVGGRVTIGEGLDRLREAVGVLIDGGQARIVLDLEETTHVDSATLGELVAARRRAAAAGGRLVLAAPRGKVRDLLDLTRLNRLLDVYESRRDALTSFV